jgi:hypothetical protein
MKRYLVFSATCIVIFFISTILYAQDTTIYIGGGASYGIEDFDGGADFDNSYGVNAKIGYHAHELMDIEFEFNYLFEFEDEDNLEILGESFDGKVDIEIMTYMIVLKGYFPLESEKIRVSVHAGGGVMYAEADVKFSGLGVSGSDTTSETDGCAKFGLGLDLLPIKHFSIGAEGSYVVGFSDLDDIRYFNFSLGVAFHF